jgi:hypothetical protein
MAEQDFRKALAICKELDLPWEQGETLNCLAQLHQLRGIQESNEGNRTACFELARLFWEQALGFFEALHAVHDTRRIQAQLRSTAV